MIRRPLSREPDLAEVIEYAIRFHQEQVNTCIPAVVTRYDPARGEVDARPLIQEAEENEEGERYFAQLPVVPHVPVLWPGAGGFRITFPLQVGEEGLLLFSQRSLEHWSEKGGEVQDPSVRMHDLTDGLFLPGLRPFAGAWKGQGGSTMTVGADDQDGPRIEITPTQIRLGGHDDAVALASKVMAELNALKTAISGAVTAGGDGGAAFKENILLALTNWPSAVASPLVKTKG